MVLEFVKGKGNKFETFGWRCKKGVFLGAPTMEDTMHIVEIGALHMTGAEVWTYS